MHKNLIHILLVAFVALSTQLSAQDFKKIIVNKWKMTHTFENGSEVKPKHKQLLITFSKKNEFTLTAAYEETHSGQYTVNSTDSTITVKDKWSKEEKVLTIKEVTKDHIIIEGYDGEGSSIECIPLSHAKAQHLSHKETLLAKRWTIYKSDKAHNLDMIFEFKYDYTFVAIPYGHKVPVAQGEWKMSEDDSKLILDMLENGDHLELNIVSIHKHELTLHNPETNISNYFHDEKLTKKDPELQKRVEEGRKEMIQNLNDEADKKSPVKTEEEVAE